MIIAIFARTKLISIVLINKEKQTMAKPIKETPILYDEDAYRFEMAFPCPMRRWIRCGEIMRK